MEMLNIFAISLFLTIILELGLGLILGIRTKDNILLLVLINIITNPVVVLIYYIGRTILTQNLWCLTLVLEVSAVIVEGYYYHRYGRGVKQPWLLSAGLNLFSYSVGYVLNRI